jgi:hypothetical protein
MSRLRIIGFALVAVFAFSIVVSSASAETFEKPGYTQPGTETALAVQTVKTTDKTTSTLENSAGETVTCKENTSTGKTVSGSFKKVEKVVVKFTGCKASIFECKTAGAAAGEIVTKSLKGVIGYLEPVANKEVGFDLEPEGAAGSIFVNFTCAGFINQEVKGSVIGKLTVTNVSVPATGHYTLAYEKGAAKGEQKIKKLNGAAEDVLLSKLGESTEFKKSNQVATVEVKYETASELKA